MPNWNYKIMTLIHLMYGPEGKSYFCFPESPDRETSGLEGKKTN